MTQGIKISRRTLAGATASAAFTCSLATMPDMARAAQERGDRISWQMCPRNCHDTCTLISHIRDGKIVRVTGDPSNPVTAGAPCVKGLTYPQYVYAKERVLHPLKRVGKKGEGKWKQITWQEAYAEIAGRLKSIIDNYGPEAILPYSYSGTLSLVNNTAGPERFFNKIGASNLERSICSSAGKAALALMYGDFASFDPVKYYPKTKLFISWGINHTATNVHGIKFINQARANGAKYIEINPVRTPTASQADLFIQPIPGTDAVLALGLANQLITTGAIDQEFIDKYTVGYEELKKLASEYPLERVSRETGVSEEEIKKLAHAYASIKPSIIRIGYGIQRHTNGGDMVRAIGALPTLVGQVGKPGGGWFYINGGYAPFDSAKASGKHLRKGTARTLSINQLGLALTGDLPETKKKPVKALIVYNSNPMNVTPNTEKVRKGLMREDLFIVVLDPMMTDTADLADIVLPASTSFEYTDVQSDYFGPYVRYNEKAIEPLGESKPNREIFFTLAKTMGFSDPEFDESEEEIIRKCVQWDLPRMKGCTFERLVKEHWFKMDIPDPFLNHKFKTPSGKIEFASEVAVKKWNAPRVLSLKRPVESAWENPKLAKKYSFTLLTPAHAKMLNSQWNNVKYIRNDFKEVVVLINPKDAKTLGIADHDLVKVKNDRGQVLARASISTETRPGVLVSWKNQWIKLNEHASTINMLTPDYLSDMGLNSTFHSNLVTISKA